MAVHAPFLWFCPIACWSFRSARTRREEASDNVCVPELETLTATPGGCNTHNHRTRIAVLIAYAVAVVCIARTHGTYWDGILRTAIIFSHLTGTFEIIKIGIENGIPFAVRGPALQIAS